MNNDRNDPGRFFGDGVTFKAKLIGILEVGEARGDRMCQEALQDLKMAIRAAGEHKQRITIHVTIDGLRLRDEKTSDSLYHHPVHKISFIAQDMTDSRAFGYIFGSPDSGHRFFGIKTDKAASQVVLAMRDLFQVVFELKKKEIEMARQQIQSKIILEHHISSKVKSTGTDPMNGQSNRDACELEKSIPKEASSESVADLVDLEQELSSIQRGITQMERITPNEPSTIAKTVTNEDPFGDSFAIYQLLPPPESTRSRYLRVNKSSDIILSETSCVSSNLQPMSNSVSVPEDTSSSTVERLGSKLDRKEVTHTLVESHLSTISTATASSTKTHTCEELSPSEGNNELSPSFLNASTSSEIFSKTSFIDAFSDLDPLGTGKSKPYIDKKYFFQDLKNPPKKVLKDLSQKDIFSATFQECESGQSNTFEISKDSLEENIEDQYSESSVKTSSLEKSKFSKDNASKLSQSSDKTFKIELKASNVSGPIMVKRDTDPFSPTRKKSDPFQEGNIFSNLDPCELESRDSEHLAFSDKNSSSVEAEIPQKDVSIFNRPLQVHLPPENITSSIFQKKMDKQASESPISGARTRPNVFKQNTVDVISSISSKKMPHLFGQKFSKRDSNNINMRRLQESDSLSENESAPEPPPRPDSISQAEPPPLPPKKQFTDIVIRPQITSSSAIQLPAKYDYVTTRIRNTTEASSEMAPPIPVPSRKIIRTDSDFSVPGRAGKKLNEEDDYLTPIPNYQEVPPLLPPPQSKSRVRRHDNIDIKTQKEPLSSHIEPTPGKPILPDITLSQLLTLGIDEIAAKLNVPTSKLNTMTLVELTACLSNFLEKSKHTQEKTNNSENSSFFQVNFERSDDTFAAKFEDNFKEETNSSFTANFENLSATTEQSKETLSNNKVPSEDRYAVFREILEEEKQNDNSEARDELHNSLSIGFETSENVSDIIQIEQSTEGIHKFPVTKIDTKITEVISHAKDRYAALRDIILVEDLFAAPKRPLENLKKSNVADIDEKNENILRQKENGRELSNSKSPSFDRKEIVSSLEPIDNKKQNISMTTVTVSNTDDLEIDEYMHAGLSNLSLECQEQLTSVMNGFPSVGNKETSPKSSLQEQNISPVDRLPQEPKSQFNDMSTSPIPQERSPIMKSPNLQSPFPQSSCEADLTDSKKPPDSGSISDAICGSSPDIDHAIDSRVENTEDVVSVNISPSAPADSWGIFGSSDDKKISLIGDKYTKYAQKLKSQGLPESPCSSDAKEEWKGDDYRKACRKGQTSSSSRDLSPWDEEISEQKKRIPDRIDKHGYYMRHARCMNSCDDDYEYDVEILKKRQRRIKGNVTRNNEKFDSEAQNWYHTSNHHNWSPREEDDSGPRIFYRKAYERGTYGPPVRDRKVSSYDNRYENRKYYREYSGPEYDFDSYTDSPDVKESNVSYYSDKGPRGYEDVYLDGLECDEREFQSRELCFDRDRKSFDRESVSSYEGTNRQRRFGREEGYGSLESREEFRKRYMGSCEKTNTLRKSVKIRSNKDGDHIRKYPSDLRNLPIANQKSRTRKGSGSSPWDCEDVILGQPLVATCQRTSKRPSSASESERRLCESRRVLCHAVTGSDGEKDRRVRRRSRIRGVEEPTQPEQCFESVFHDTDKWDVYDFIDCDDYADSVDEDKFARLNSRQRETHHRLNQKDYPRRCKALGNSSFNNDDDGVITTKSESRLKKNSFFSNTESKNSLDIFGDQVPMPHNDNGERRGLDINIFVQTPPKIPGCNKFNYEEQGFESDFNSPPHLPADVSSIPVKPTFRFSSDFTEKENKLIVNSDNFEQEEQIFATAPKLRFDDNGSNFNNERSAALSKFEDDFSTSEFVLEHDDLTSELRKCNNSSRLLPKQRQQDQIKKSESINIFGRKSEDPFEDDDFFKSAPPVVTTDNDSKIENAYVTKSDIKNKNSTDSLLKWENNFAKFDENM